MVAIVERIRLPSRETAADCNDCQKFSTFIRTHFSYKNSEYFFTRDYFLGYLRPVLLNLQLLNKFLNTPISGPKALENRFSFLPCKISASNTKMTFFTESRERVQNLVRGVTKTESCFESVIFILTQLC